jgi:hypothetical protein
MLTRLLWASLPAVLAGTIGMQSARADMYTWVDSSGSINVSNIAPPDGVHVTSVSKPSAQELAARDAAARDAARQAEVQALSDRVRQLEDEVQLGNRQAPPQVEYRPVPPPPMMMQYAPSPMPAAQYAPAPPSYNGCDSAGFDCGLWGVPGIYPTSIIFLRVPNFRRPKSGRDGHQFAVHQPMRTPGVSRRG